MHIIESYSLNCGAKIGKPFIYKTFFPLPFEKYIIFFAGAKIAGKEYAYYQDVIDLIYPYLENHNIKMVQVGPKESFVYEGVINLCGQLNINQTAYLIEKAQLYFGIDGFESQAAGDENIPIVSINTLNYSQNTGPYFGDKTKQVVLESFRNIGNGKASFNINEYPKSVNSIKPELLANSILKNLGLGSEIKIETLHTGEKYSHLRIEETLLNFKEFPQKLNGLVEIRADLGYNEENLFYQLSQSQKAVIVAEGEVSLNILSRLKDKITAFVFKVGKENKSEFLKKVKEIGINIILISEMTPEEISNQKIHYYDFGNINKLNEPSQELIDKLKKDLDRLFYRSCKTTISDGKFYSSLAASRLDYPIHKTHEYQKVIDSPEFWKNLDFFTIIKLN